MSLQRLVSFHLFWRTSIFGLSAVLLLGCGFVSRNEENPKYLAYSENVPPEQLEIVAYSKKTNRGYYGGDAIRAEIAARIDLPVLLARRFAKDPKFRLRAALAANQAIPPDILVSLSNDGEGQVRANVAGNMATPPIILRKLASDPHPSVRSALGVNPFFSPKLVRPFFDGPVNVSSIRVQSAIFGRSDMTIRPNENLVKTYLAGRESFKQGKWLNASVGRIVELKKIVERGVSETLASLNDSTTDIFFSVGILHIQPVKRNQTRNQNTIVKSTRSWPGAHVELIRLYMVDKRKKSAILLKAERGNLPRSYKRGSIFRHKEEDIGKMTRALVLSLRQLGPKKRKSAKLQRDSELVLSRFNASDF